VKNRFQNLPFKSKLQRYTTGGPHVDSMSELAGFVGHAVGLCRLNQVDP
jgi:hypothetical protein